MAHQFKFEGGISKKILKQLTFDLTGGLSMLSDVPQVIASTKSRSWKLSASLTYRF